MAGANKLSLGRAYFRVEGSLRLSFRRFFAVLLICGILSIVGSGGASAASLCDDLFRSPESKQLTPVHKIIEFAGAVSYRSVARSNVEALFEDLLNSSKVFADFVARRAAPESLSTKRKADLIVQYHDEFFAEFRDPEKLREFQNRSLLSALRRHGYSPRSPDARAELQNLSRANYERIEKERGLRDPRKSDRDVEELMAQLDLTLFRNSHREDVTSGLILSSRRLEVYGLGGGLNSRQNFNRDFLRSDDQIFFFVKMRPADFSGVKSSYGKYRQKLKVKEFSGDVWISPFVMYEADLNDFARRSLPQLTVRANPTTVRSNLHLFDFTFEDYENLIRRQLRGALTSLKRNPLARFKYGLSYAQAKAQLLNPSTRKEEDPVMDALVHRPLGLPKMEAKIPVALSQAAIKGFGE